MAKIITLSNGERVLVSDHRYEFLSRWTWHFVNGYAARSQRIDGHRVRIYMHRVIASTPDHLQTDHINHNKLDNRDENLRNVTAAQNIANCRKGRGSFTSRYKGVQQCKRDDRWIASIKVDGKAVRIGAFDTEIEAAKEYNKVAREVRGEFAHLNKV